MLRTVLALVCAAIALPAQTATPTKAIDGETFASTMSFEAEHVSGKPKDWGGGPPATIAVDDKIVHSGRWSVRIDRTAVTENPPFSTVTRSLPVTFRGKKIELRGFIRTENVSDFVGLWLREDGPTPSLQFDNMQHRKVKGTRDWTEYSIVLPIHPEATRVFFGFLVAGKGKAWADDLQLLVDGKPVWEAPQIKRAETVLQTDKELDGGSRVNFKELASIQTSNLQMLGKVWGFLKYHHPSVTTGKVHWDY